MRADTTPTRAAPSTTACANRHRIRSLLLPGCTGQVCSEQRSVKSRSSAGFVECLVEQKRVDDRRARGQSDLLVYRMSDQCCGSVPAGCRVLPPMVEEWVDQVLHVCRMDSSRLQVTYFPRQRAWCCDIELLVVWALFVWGSHHEGRGLAVHTGGSGELVPVTGHGLGRSPTVQ